MNKTFFKNTFFLFIVFQAVFLFTPLFGQDHEYPDSSRPFISGTIKTDTTKGEILVEAVFFIPEGYYQSYNPEYFNIRLAGNGHLLSDEQFPVADKYRGQTLLKAVFKQTESGGNEKDSEDQILTINYQLCDEAGTCFFPKSFHFPFSAAPGSEMSDSFLLEAPDYPQFTKENDHNDPFSNFTDNFTGNASENNEIVETAKKNTADETWENNSSADTGDSENLIETSNIERFGAGAQQRAGGSGIFVILILAFVGGVLLNVMPCVLPVLSIKALHLVQLREENKQASIQQGLLYSLGILLSLAVFGALAALLKAFGEGAGWGFQFQNPFFTLSLGVFIFIFALSMFDIFIINIPGFNLAAMDEKNGKSSAFFSGILAVLLATPCTAPFMGASLGFAFSQGPWLIFFTFIFIGAGLALPFLLISIFPGSLKWIPKPGNWMNIFKAFMGFLLLGTFGWLLNSSYYQIGWAGVILVFYLLLGITVLLWILGMLQKGYKHDVTRKILLILTLLLIVVGIWQAGSRSASFNDDFSLQSDTWQSFDEIKLETALGTGKGVFVAFGAQWCLTCKTNETAVLRTEEIQTLFEQEDILLLYGDFTNGDKTVARWIQNYGRAGVPVYAYYSPGDTVPRVLPEVISKRMVYALFEE